MSEPRLLKLTPEQVKRGWMELQGVTPIHHEYQIMSKQADGNYVVVNPRWIIEQQHKQKE